MNEYTYQLIENAGIVLRSDGASIPLDESNSDYQAYLNKDNPNWGKGTIS